MSDVFISYASEDRLWAKMIAEALEGEGRSGGTVLFLPARTSIA
jgi:hypothetical protein